MVCRRYTRAFLHPLAAKGLPFAANLITYHNIAYMMVRDRESISNDSRRMGEDEGIGRVCWGVVWGSGLGQWAMLLSCPCRQRRCADLCIMLNTHPTTHPFPFLSLLHHAFPACSAFRSRSGRPLSSSGIPPLCASMWRGSIPRETTQSGCGRAASSRAYRWTAQQQRQVRQAVQLGKQRRQVWELPGVAMAARRRQQQQ